MNILVVGLGSMGKRRIRLIRKYDDSYRIIGVDLNLERRKNIEDEFGIETSNNIEDVFSENKINCAFICTSPLSHYKLINLSLKNNAHVFTELNLVSDGYDDNIRLSKENNKILFLSSTFLYRAEIKKINTFVSSQEKPLNYIYHVGQYLPDWHPWEDYKNFFVNDKRTNGCREIFAIELPWIYTVFGRVKNILVIKNKISSLNLDYNDNYMVIIEHFSGHKGMMEVDIVSRKAVRNLEIFSEDLYLAWDGSANGLKKYNFIEKKEEIIKLYDEVDQLKQYSKFVIENAYFDEIVAFFDTINNRCTPIYNFEKDKEILELIDRIEE